MSERPSLLQELLASDDKEPDEPELLEQISPTGSDYDESEQKPKTPKTKTIKQKFRKVLPMVRVARLPGKPKEEKSKPDPRDGLGAKVAQLRDGNTFGELALQRSDNKRAASVVTDTDVSYTQIFCITEYSR